MNRDPARGFRQRLRAGERLTGTFVKTPAPILCEVLAQTGLDAVCLDAEHAPFGRAELDACVHAVAAAGAVALVRVPAARPEYVLQALDSGAAGILVPHVQTSAQAADIARWARFGERGRGYAGSPRAAGYGAKPMAEHLADSRESISVIVQLEDLAAFDQLEAIVATEGIDAVFVGRVDLTVALGAGSTDAPEVRARVERICQAAREAGRSVGMFVPGADEVDHWSELGASLFMAGSDHGLLRAGANALHQALSNQISNQTSSR